MRKNLALINLITTKFTVKMNKKYYLLALILLALTLKSPSQMIENDHKRSSTKVDTIIELGNMGEYQFEIDFSKGKEFNHPSFAIWLETTDGQYIQTLFVTKSFATGIYGHGDSGDGSWKTEPGESIRKAALPYWAHKRNVISRDSLFIPTPENPLTDALSGATPTNDFIIFTDNIQQLPQKFVLLFEINQAFDFNTFWNNMKFGKDNDYLTSGQPSVVYAVTIDKGILNNSYYLNPIGHGSPMGADGTLNTDLSSLSTALQISGKVKVSIKD